MCVVLGRNSPVGDAVKETRAVPLAGESRRLTAGAAPDWNSSALTGGKVESRMLKRRLRVLLSVVAGFGFGVAMPATAGAVVIGVDDTNPAMFSDPRFLALNVTTARYTIPWDVVTRRADRGDLAAFRAWYRLAQADLVSPLISFGADYTN